MSGPAAPTRPTYLAHGRWLGDFPRLTAAEKALVACCARGEAWTPRNWDGTRPEAPTRANTIRADLIRFLALGGDAAHPVHESGVMLGGACIADKFDVHQCRLPTRLHFQSCSFVLTPVFVAASLPELVLRGCLVPGLDGDRLRVAGEVVMDKAFYATGEVRLFGAQIGGNLECGAGSFVNPEGDALVADLAVIKGSMVLNGGFSATGAVRVLRAQIGGDLNCREGSFVNLEGNALSADLAVIKGSMVLDRGFSATGEVRLAGAQIGGNLDCGKGSFANAEGCALSAEGAVVKGNVLLNAEFSATGSVRLLGAEIGGDLECGKGSFANPEGKALSADGATVKGGFFLRGAKCTDSVSLPVLRVGTLIDDRQCWTAGGNNLDGFSYDRIIGPTDATMRIAWLRSQRPDHLGADFRPQPWEQLAKVLREMGHPHEARRIAIEKQRAMRRAGIRGLPPATTRFGGWRNGKANLRALSERLYLPLRHPLLLLDEVLHRLFGLVSGYGHRPWNILGWVVVLWLGFAALYWGLGVGCARLTGCTANHASATLYSLDALLPVDFGMVKGSLPTEPLGGPDSTHLPVRALSVIETLIGWIFGVLVLAIVGNLVRKD